MANVVLIVVEQMTEVPPAIIAKLQAEIDAERAEVAADEAEAQE